MAVATTRKSQRTATKFPTSAAMRSQAPAPSDPLAAELWVPTRFDATIPLGTAHWLRTHFPDDRDAEAFISMAVITAVSDARKGGAR